MRPRAAATNSDRAGGGQAQRAGQPHRGVVAGRAVDAPLQVTDRPRAHPGRLGQLLLRQLGPGPQLPQQPSEPRGGLLRHDLGIPSPRPQPARGNKHGAGRACANDYPGQAPAPPVPAPASPLPGPAAAAPTGTRDRHAAPATGAVLPGLPRARRPPPPPAPSCGSPVRRTGADHTGRRPHQDQRQPGRAGPRTARGRTGDRPRPRAYPGGEALMGGQNPPRSRGPWRNRPANTGSRRLGMSRRGSASYH